jgi:hypothetical protein
MRMDRNILMRMREPVALGALVAITLLGLPQQARGEDALSVVPEASVAAATMQGAAPVSDSVLGALSGGSATLVLASSATSPLDVRLWDEQARRQAGSGSGRAVVAQVSFDAAANRILISNGSVR